MGQGEVSPDLIFGTGSCFRTGVPGEAAGIEKATREQLIQIQEGIGIEVCHFPARPLLGENRAVAGEKR